MSCSTSALTHALQELAAARASQELAAALASQELAAALSSASPGTSQAGGHPGSPISKEAAVAGATVAQPDRQGRAGGSSPRQGTGSRSSRQLTIPHFFSSASPAPAGGATGLRQLTIPHFFSTSQAAVARSDGVRRFGTSGEGLNDGEGPEDTDCQPQSEPLRDLEVHVKDLSISVPVSLAARVRQPPMEDEAVAAAAAAAACAAQAVSPAPEAQAQEGQEGQQAVSPAPDAQAPEVSRGGPHSGCVPRVLWADLDIADAEESDAEEPIWLLGSSWPLLVQSLQGTEWQEPKSTIEHKPAKKQSLQGNEWHEPKSTTLEHKNAMKQSLQGTEWQEPKSNVDKSGEATDIEHKNAEKQDESHALQSGRPPDRSRPPEAGRSDVVIVLELIRDSLGPQVLAEVTDLLLECGGQEEAAIQLRGRAWRALMKQATGIRRQHARGKLEAGSLAAFVKAIRQFG